MAFRRRRLRLRRRRRPIRRSRRRVKRRSRLKSKARRKQRLKAYLTGYSFAKHLEGPMGEISVDTPEPTALTSAGASGLFAYADADKIFDQVKNIDDFVYPSMTGTGTLGWKAGRQNLTIRVKGEVTYTVTNGNQAGAAWLEVYICKPRKGINANGIGTGPNWNASDIINNNRNSAFVTDYNDAQGITLGALPFPIQNATSQTKPTVGTTNFLLTPYMIPPFTENFKVIKQLKYVLPPGGQCIFKVKTRFLRVGRQTWQTKGTDGGATAADYGFYRPAFGRDIFFRWHGQPAHDSATTPHPVNYGAVALDVVGIKRYWFSHSLRPLPNYFLQANQNQGTLTAAGTKLPSNPPEPVAEN